MNARRSSPYVGEHQPEVVQARLAEQQAAHEPTDPPDPRLLDWSDLFPDDEETPDGPEK